MTDASRVPEGPAPGAMAAPAATSERRVAVDAPAAQLLAWCALAILNQVLIVVLLPAVPGRLRLAHAAYDAGHLLLLGVVSFALVRAAEYGMAKAALGPRLRRWLPVAALALLVVAVSMLTVAEDVVNFADRYEIKPSLANLAASLIFAGALSVAALVRLFRHWAVRILTITAGLALAVGNALLLENDYFATHLMIAWLGALSIAGGLQGLRLPLSRRAQLIAAALLGMAALPAYARPPSSVVLRRLYSLPSSVVAPILARFLPEQTGAALDRVPAAYLKSPWFHDRSQLAPVAPTRSITPPEPTIVILLTIDAVRADVLERSKYARLLPELHALKKSSVYFSGARSPTPATTTTMASLFTGRYYSQLRWAAEGDSMVMLRDPGPRLPALLSKAGVTTIHAASLGRIRSANGVGQGFSNEIWIPKSKTRGADAVTALMAEIDKAQGKPLFVYTHFTEPHAPYDLGGKKGKPFDRYVREIAVVDSEITRLRAFLKDKGLEQRTILIVSADHGEAFGEHKTHYHAVSAYEELLHVPMIVHVPGVAARQVDAPVSLIDLAPTVLDLFGLPVPGVFMGESLMPLVAGKVQTLSRPVAADTGRHQQALYFPDGKKVINDVKRHTIEVYDLKADPGELTNLVGSDDPNVEAVVETTKLFFEVHRCKDPGYATPWIKF